MGHDDHDDGMMGWIGLVAHLYEVGRGDPETEPEVLAVTMSNQARPGQVKLQSKRGKKKSQENSGYKGMEIKLRYFLRSPPLFKVNRWSAPAIVVEV